MDTIIIIYYNYIFIIFIIVLTKCDTCWLQNSCFHIIFCFSSVQTF